MTTTLTPPADEPLVHDVDSTEDAPTYTRESLGDALGRANHVAWEARQERDALLADHARLTAEVADLRDLCRAVGEAKHPPSVDELIDAQMTAAVARTEVAMLTEEVARLRAFKLHAASCYNAWANGDTSPHAAVAALEAIGDELGEPFAEGDRE